MRVGKELKQVKALLTELANAPGLTQLVPSHGDILRSGARQVARAHPWQRRTLKPGVWRRVHDQIEMRA